MGRADKAPSGTLPPEQWPDWVLDFGGGYFPDDPVRQGQRKGEFRSWQRDRDGWFEAHGISDPFMACLQERGRRAMVWQAEHPEDVGPHLKT